ncbi:hypothetical protein DFH28DRAFT_1189848 [Melampsora americana]|nr:hypothetical protein DFH28DRAFT_1189848 [Melampsora americana]
MDVFEDDWSDHDANMADPDSGNPSTRGTPQLRHSQSSMSIDATINPPQTPANSQTRDASALFHPPRTRPIPPSTTRPSRTCLKKFADILKLSKENRELVQQLCENTQPHEEYAATMSYLAYLGQEVFSKSDKWVAEKYIRDTFKKEVARLMLQPTLQAFSSIAAGDRSTLPRSLEVLTFEFLKGLKPEVVEEHCAEDYTAGEGCAPGSSMFVFIKDILKNKRSKVRSTLLTNILGVREGSVLTVPTAKTMVVDVVRVFLPDTRTMEVADIMTELGPDQVRWIIWMRYVTVYAYLNHTENKRRCQWTIMDQVLADLRRPDHSDDMVNRQIYFKQIVRYDREAFNGQRTWAEVKGQLTLHEPDVGLVLTKFHKDRTAIQQENTAGPSRSQSGSREPSPEEEVGE